MIKIIKKTAASAAVILLFVAVLAGCGRREGEQVYKVSSELFSSSYDISNLYNYYDPDAFRLDGQKMTYADTQYYESRLGIDVSEHNGDIDWERVRKDGYSFVFLRIGYRGYGDEGTLQEDVTFESNYEAARKAGLSVGVYFFSQAVNETEAKEEADYVLSILDGRELELPVAYDIESIDSGDSARTDSVSGDQFTANTKAFAMEIADGGYSPCLYTNLMWETFTLDMRELHDLPVWFSGYEKTPSTTYNFDFWQYSNTGSVDGIDGDVDLNIQMIPVEQNQRTES